MTRPLAADQAFDFDDPKTALDYLQARPGFVLRRSQQILTSLFTAECQRVSLNITESQLDTLTLVAADMHPDQITLARRLGYDRSTTTSVIDGLARRHLVKRRIKSDRRRRSIELTAGAQNILNKALKCSQRADKTLFSRRSRSEATQIMNVLEEVAMNAKSSAPAWEPLYPAGKQPTRGHRYLPAIYRTPRFLMGRCIQIGSSFLIQEIGQLGFTGGAQHGTLFLIAALGPADQATVARALRLDKSSVSIIMSTLQARGLIERGDDPGDRRRLLVNVTPAGLQLLKEARPRIRRADQRVFEGLSSGARERFVGSLSHLVASHSGFIATDGQHEPH
jgi:DNA-binding MarR family transcriptional regulator